ncbi:amidohydrolase family protein [Albidovulum sediminis]|uniref:Amidohydrolase family protein n=1 Tax=Albidovulum sediminis TaxID=3066345 RepID=A0ABT2NK66_9RHOB|nr:amidohydrolase family protein [Defluviimonas sediminis]MCT8329317.1 amidohydrolase family protein [Defluviimonas sediminis]
MTGTTYANLRDLDGRPTAIRCRNGLIEAIGPDVAAPDAIDSGGRLVLPAFVEPHVHLDKTLWGEDWVPGRRAARLRDYIDNERRVLGANTTPPEVRAGRLLGRMLAQGTTAVRSHIDVAPDIGLAHVEAMFRLREAWADRIDLQFVAFPQQGLLCRPGTADLMREAIAMGVETVGGLDPAGIDGDPEGQLRFIFDLAAETGAGVDIHLHDKGELGAWQVRRIADHTAAAGLSGRVMISHAYCLGMIAEAELDRIGKRLADLGISLMSSVPADIAVPPIERLHELGVTVCVGSDGIRDAWSPLGNGDMLERAFLAAFRFDWNTDEDFRRALSCATDQAARAIGLAGYGLQPGNRADFVLLDAVTPGDALARRPAARTVVRRGAVVAG